MDKPLNEYELTQERKWVHEVKISGIEFEFTKPSPIICGIYFLLDGAYIVYVGKSYDVHGRIKDHTKDKKFTNVMFFKCEEDALGDIEDNLIKELRPPYNKRGVASDKRNTLCNISYAQKMVCRLFEEYKLKPVTEVL